MFSERKSSRNKYKLWKGFPLHFTNCIIKKYTANLHENCMILKKVVPFFDWPLEDLGRVKVIQKMQFDFGKNKKKYQLS